MLIFELFRDNRVIDIVLDFKPTTVPQNTVSIPDVLPHVIPGFFAAPDIPLDFAFGIPALVPTPIPFLDTIEVS